MARLNNAEDSETVTYPETVDSESVYDSRVTTKAVSEVLPGVGTILVPVRVQGQLVIVTTVGCVTV